MLLPLDDALKIISDKVVPTNKTETCDLSSALYRVAAEDMAAAYALPPFTNTGVDGYAFRHTQEQNFYKLVGASFAGESYQGTLQEGEAARIATGAVLPDGADTVVMQEVCKIEGEILYIEDLPMKGANLRLAGGDIQKGESAVLKGQLLRPQEIAILSALGIDVINCVSALRVAIVSTGHELLKSSETPKSGQIVDTNSLMLGQMLQRPGIEVTKLPPLPDDYNSTKDALLKASADYNVIITTGGVSVGDRDYVRDVLHDESNVHFWKLAIRPGKPAIVGNIGSCVMVGLPGNPVSAYVTSFLIVRAVFNALQGRETALPDGFTVTLGEDILKPDHLRAFPRARFSKGFAWPYAEQGSNLYTSLTNADGILDLPAGQSAFKRGDQVIYRPFTSLM